MTGRPRGDRGERQRALQEAVQRASGMLPLEVVDPLSSETRGGPPETVPEGNATHDRPADPTPVEAKVCSECGRPDGDPDPWCSKVRENHPSWPEPTAVTPVNCQACGGQLANGESFLCDACSSAAYVAEVDEAVDAYMTPERIEAGLSAIIHAVTPPWRTHLGPAEPIRVTRPGVYQLDADEYHDPDVTGDWLSNSDARQLTDDGCPAQFRYDRDNRIRKTSDAFAMGHAVHARILGKGERIAVRPAEWDSWRTKAAQAWRAEQEAAGLSVILPEQAEAVDAMAAAVHLKPRAHELLSQPGRPEVALFWVCPETGVRRRCLIDYLPDGSNEHGIMEPVDIKSADSVAPTTDMERKLYDHAWHRQGTTIADGLIALGLAEEVDFHFVVQSKRAPHLVTIVRLDADAERIGRIENTRALLVYRECLDTGVWPDYAPEPVTLSVPAWIARIYEEEVN